MKSAIYFFAFRYALGRMTYAVKEVADEIADNITEISTKDLSLMLKEIDEAARANRLGMECDAQVWINLTVCIQNELDRRVDEISK